MRIVAVVVAGAVLLVSVHAASAADPKRQRSEKCLEICNFTFEQCQKETSPKANQRCNVDVVRCKNACPFETIEEPAVPTAVSHQRCIDACREVYQKCLRRPENKSGGNCAADDVRCEQACPKPPEPVVAGAPSEGGAAGAPAAAAPAKKPKRGLRVEGSAAPAPPDPTPVIVPNVRPAAERPAAVPAHGEAASPAAVAPAAAASAPAAPTAAEAAAAARPAPEERGFWATLGCFFVQCEQPGTTPCVQQCGDAYDQCRMRESKRGGECNTRLMNCRKACSEAAR